MSDNQFHESLQQLGLEQTVLWQPPPLVWEMFSVGSSLQSSWSPFSGTKKAAIKGVYGWTRLTLHLYIELGLKHPCFPNFKPQAGTLGKPPKHIRNK